MGIRAGVLQPQGEHCLFTQSYAFSSFSAAATVVTGYPSNGALAWRTQDGSTYKEWEARKLGVREAVTT